MSLSNPYVISTMAGCVSCGFLFINTKLTNKYGNNNEVEKTNSPTDYLKLFCLVAILVFISLSMISPSSSNKIGGGKPTNIIQETFNTGNPGF